MNTTNLVTVITEEEIKSAIQKVATDLAKQFENEELIIVSELSGVFVFMADLIRELPIDATIQFITNIEKDGLKMKIDLESERSLKDKNVLILADVFAKGNALTRIYDIVKTEEPKDVSILALVNKDVKDKNTDLPVTSLFNIDDSFLVGYGLTQNRSYRGLKSIYRIQDEEQK